MYRIFRKLERWVFGIVTASAVACAGFIVVERCGASFASAAHAALGSVFACEPVGQPAECDALLAEWREVK
ncbi:MAG: hypothetical protein V4793_07110 [Paraburkholderia tropica]|uniref:Lipoprotein n=1 Tax=Paraburkholderia tropica TaxID=92647 RepID=A0ABX5MNA5_9BURK|nr:hypothetical protein [Paraburkholderia tropica]MDE1144028.1 hypothetical protein [Paraburkholderia tropica]PXX11496.1 hypothetical protein C7400_11963 [Paraburkholderia tropica]PZW76159.1 hypothetical protein C7399_11963 [Paraburkholderia tropica]